MESQIFINLAVADLGKSMEFYTKMGFKNNPKFSDDTAKCMVWSDTILLMIMTHEKFKGFTNRPLANTKSHIAALYALSVESLGKVNEVVENALSAGAKEPVEMSDYGFMQQRTIEDFDGHSWEIFYMDESKFPTE